MSALHKYLYFQYPVLIRESHIDTLGHMNNATYLQLFEEARWEFISNRGYDLKCIQSSGLGPVILEIRIKFLREVRLREKIIIESVGLNYGGKTGLLKQTMFNEKQEVCCEAEMVFGLFNLNERKLVPPTPEWLHAIGQVVLDK